MRTDTLLSEQDAVTPPHSAPIEVAIEFAADEIGTVDIDVKELEA